MCVIFLVAGLNWSQAFFTHERKRGKSTVENARWSDALDEIRIIIKCNNFIPLRLWDNWFFVNGPPRRRVFGLLVLNRKSSLLNTNSNNMYTTVHGRGLTAFTGFHVQGDPDYSFKRKNKSLKVYKRQDCCNSELDLG